jgi:hypothetical protein
MAIIRSPKPEIHHESWKHYVIYEIKISSPIKNKPYKPKNGTNSTKKEHTFQGKNRCNVVNLFLGKK